MERGDVHAVRLAQQEERQEGHERLVEMQDVEALAVEHLGHQLPVAVRHGEGADGAAAQARRQVAGRRHGHVIIDRAGACERAARDGDGAGAIDAAGQQHHAVADDSDVAVAVGGSKS